MPAEPHRQSTSGIQKLKHKWRLRRTYRATRRASARELTQRAKRKQQQEKIGRRLGDPRRTPASEPPLGMLREVGLAQLAMQGAGAGILVAQAGAVLAGAGLLAAANIALGGWPAVLVIDVLSAVFALRALLGVRSSTGPTPFQILDVRNIFNEPAEPLFLADDELEWLLIGDVEAAIHENATRLQARAQWVSRAVIVLLIGLATLAFQQLDPMGHKASPRHAVKHGQATKPSTTINLCFGCQTQVKLTDRSKRFHSSRWRRQEQPHLRRRYRMSPRRRSWGGSTYR
jgi:hypothetical protein